MPISFPQHYRVALLSDGTHAVLSAPRREPILAGAPPEFGGSDDVWSPEQLLLAAVNACLMTTFQALAAREPFASLEYRDHVEGTIDRTREGLRFVTIKHYVELRVPPEDRARAAALLERARKHCLIANSLNLPVEVEAVFTDGTPRASAEAPGGGR
jgi:organic hydroperoxide reductase OsmC/OhrA